MQRRISRLDILGSHYLLDQGSTRTGCHITHILRDNEHISVWGFNPRKDKKSLISLLAQYPAQSEQIGVEYYPEEEVWFDIDTISMREDFFERHPEIAEAYLTREKPKTSG